MGNICGRDPLCTSAQQSIRRDNRESYCNTSSRPNLRRSRRPEEETTYGGRRSLLASAGKESTCRSNQGKGNCLTTSLKK